MFRRLLLDLRQTSTERTVKPDVVHDQWRVVVASGCVALQVFDQILQVAISSAVVAFLSRATPGNSISP